MKEKIQFNDERIEIARALSLSGNISGGRNQGIGPSPKQKKKRKAKAAIIEIVDELVPSLSVFRRNGILNWLSRARRKIESEDPNRDIIQVFRRPIFSITEIQRRHEKHCAEAARVGPALATTIDAKFESTAFIPLNCWKTIIIIPIIKEDL